MRRRPVARRAMRCKPSSPCRSRSPRGLRDGGDREPRRRASHRLRHRSDPPDAQAGDRAARLSGKKRHPAHGPVAGFSKLISGPGQARFLTTRRDLHLAQPASEPVPHLERRHRVRDRRDLARLETLAAERADLRALVQRRNPAAPDRGGSGLRRRPWPPPTPGARFHRRFSRPVRDRQDQGDLRQPQPFPPLIGRRGPRSRARRLACSPP